jgi:Skp family chaperone for outer membrane proteins
MKSFKLACVFASVLSSISMNAESAHHEKHGHGHIVTVVISTKRVIDESIRGKDIQKRINDEQASVTSTFPAMEANIRAKEALAGQLQNSYNEKIKSLEAKSKMISEDARNKEIDELQDIRRQIEETTADRERLIRKFNEEAKKAEQRLEAFYKKEMAAFEVEIKDIIASAKSAHGWDIIHPREALLDASEKVDTTSIIIELLDTAETKRREAKLAEKKVTASVKKAA